MSILNKQRKRAILIAVITLVFFLLYKIIFNPSLFLIKGVSSLVCPSARTYFNTDEPLIALTIDDSPDDNHSFPHTTLGILDVLATYEVKATFFIITNKAKKYPELLTAMVKQGHELGNHLTDDVASIRLGDRFETELLESERFLTQFATINWFRPGHGRCDRKMRSVIQKYNYQTVLGSVWSYDTTVISSSKFSSWYIQKNIHPGGIIILHDSDSKKDIRGKNTIQTLQKIIPQLQAAGYRFVTLSELQAQEHS